MVASLPHGGNVEAYARLWSCQVSDILDLSTGLHPWGAPAWLGDWLAEHADLIGHYPDSAGEPARSALAEFMGVSPHQVVMLAGAQAAIEILPQAFDWQNMAIRQPCYSEPIRAAERVNCKVIAHDMSQDWTDEVAAIWLTSPHNPCGKVEAFPANRHGVLDESYMAFSERQQLGILPKVLRLGSLTKTCGIPGLRLGYMIAEEALVAQVQRWLPPWPCSTLGLHLLPKLLKETKLRDEHIEHANHRLTLLLQKFGWCVSASACSFILAKPPLNLPDFASQCILVRSFPEWDDLSGWVRLGLPNSEQDWQRLHDVLAAHEGC